MSATFIEIGANDDGKLLWLNVDRIVSISNYGPSTATVIQLDSYSYPHTVVTAESPEALIDRLRGTRIAYPVGS